MVSGRGFLRDRFSAALYQYVVRVCGAVRRMDAYWVMPFRHKCEITFHNLGTQPVRLCDGRVRYAPWKWDDRSMHFGASWHQYGAVSTGRDKHQNTDDTGGPSDLRFVALDGQGVYVGDGLTLFNTEYAWWGEGDEKVYVDGETFPSHLGTGSEDYYGYAWGRRERITDHPFIAQPEGAGADSAGFVQNTRLRVLDGIPFRTSLRFDMELWHHLRAVVDYARRLTGTCVRAGAAWSNRTRRRPPAKYRCTGKTSFRRKWR